MAKKININSFTKAEMTARLLILQTNWSKQPKDTVLNKTKAITYAKKLVKANFIYPEDKLDSLSMNLLLFLYGNKKNIFDKAI